MQCAPHLRRHPPALSLSRASFFFPAAAGRRDSPASHQLLVSTSHKNWSRARARGAVYTRQHHFQSGIRRHKNLQNPRCSVWAVFFPFLFSFFLLEHFFRSGGLRRATFMASLNDLLWPLVSKKTHSLLLMLNNCNLKASGLEKFFFRVRCDPVLHNLSVHRCSNHSRSTVPPVHHPPPPNFSLGHRVPPPCRFAPTKSLSILVGFGAKRIKSG